MDNDSLTPVASWLIRHIYSINSILGTILIQSHLSSTIFSLLFFLLIFPSPPLFTKLCTSIKRMNDRCLTTNYSPKIKMHFYSFIYVYVQIKIFSRGTCTQSTGTIRWSGTRNIQKRLQGRSTHDIFPGSGRWIRIPDARPGTRNQTKPQGHPL